MTAVTVLGAGAWGTALALVLARSGAQVRLWTWEPAHAQAIEADRENKAFFPGFSLPDGIRATASLEQALSGVDLVLVVVPSHALRETLRAARPYLRPDAVLVSATKGIENDSSMLMTEVMLDELGPTWAQRVLALSGPSFAKEVALDYPTNVVLAGADEQLVRDVQHRIGSERFRIYSSDDSIGVEMGGAIKNVIAIAAGACDGLGFGHNTRAALITRGLAEITRLAVAKGGQPLTLAGLAGMGDLVLTCTGELSRNRTVGFELGRGAELGPILRDLGHVAEGVPTSRSAYQLARRLDVDAPLCTAVYLVLHEGKPSRDAVRDIFARPLRRERD
jgi:glycerol-3-phosphate dehydrogenase (NAD(P)+)